MRDVMNSYCRVAEYRCVAKYVSRYWEWAPRVHTGRYYYINIRQQSMVGLHRIIAMMIVIIVLIIILHSSFFFMLKYIGTRRR